MKTSSELHRLILDILSDGKEHVSSELFEEMDKRLGGEVEHKKISDSLYYMGSKKGWIVSEGTGKSRIYKIKYEVHSGESMKEQSWLDKYIKNVKKVVKDGDTVISALKPENLLKSEKVYMEYRRIYEVNEILKKLVDELMKNEVEKSGAKSQGGEVCTINEISEMRPE